MTIRPCTREELPLVHAHAQKGLDAGELCVAERDGDIVGTMICLHRQGDAYRSVRWAAEYDMPVMARVHEQGLRAIRLDTYEKNLPAARLCERCGLALRGDLGLEETTGLKWLFDCEKVL